MASKTLVFRKGHPWRDCAYALAQEAKVKGLEGFAIMEFISKHLPEHLFKNYRLIHDLEVKI